MVLQVTNSNNVKIYSVTAAAKSAIPDWLARKSRKSLKKDPEWERRIELIQDFDFPEASVRVKVTRDQKHIMATGVYKPQMRVFELAEMSMKFDRHTDCENVQFEILSDDWTKTVHLQSDRSIEFHSQSGMHFKTRVPKFGRDLSYHYPSCDLLVVGASNEVWRLNLDQGRFMTSLPTNMPGINVCEVNPAHQLWAFGGENGVIEFWDPRSRNRLVSLNVAQTLLKTVGDVYMNGRNKVEVTAMKFANDGLSLGVGTSTGHVLLFDLRNDYPTVTKDHQYGFPIKNILFHSSGNVLSADQKIIKVWDKHSGDMFTSIEPPHDINDVCTFGDDTGLVMVANEGSQIQTYYVPQLGPSPKWCSFLDNLTEEMEENPNTTFYDDYKFVSRKELQALNLDHLIGTNLLRAYMHGFFVDLRLYEKAKAIANPFAYDDYKKQQIEKKIEQERGTRISAKRKLPKVNKRLAEKLLQDTTAEKDDAVDDTAEANLFKDSRFGELFTNPDYQVDETTEEYRLRHPNEAKKNIVNRFEKVEDSESEDVSESDASPMEDSDDDVFGRDSREEEPRKAKQVKKDEPKPSKPTKPQKGKQPAFYEIKHGAKLGSAYSRSATKSFGDRLQTEDIQDNNLRLGRNRTGNMSMTFKAGGGRRKFGGGDRDRNGDRERKQNKRGVRELKGGF